MTCSSIFESNSKFTSIAKCQFDSKQTISILNSGFVSGDTITIRAGVYRSAHVYAS